MALQTTATKRSPALLPRWANQQDGWARGIVTDILRNRVEASNADIDHYVDLLLREKKLSPNAYETIPPIEEQQYTDATLEAFKIGAVKIGAGINALKPGTQIEFGVGVTVIFGENGSGKSGFVRVLKRAAGARIAEDILPDIRDDDRPTPSATFTVTLGTSTYSIEWVNQFGVAPLNRAFVFDSRGARVHVEEDLTYVYTAGELNLFPLVQNAIERVRARLEATISTKTPGTNTILNSFDREYHLFSHRNARCRH